MMSSVPVDAVNTHDDADLVQWLLASEMAQDVVFQSLVKGGAVGHEGHHQAVASPDATRAPAPRSADRETSLAMTSSAHRFTSSVGNDLCLDADVPKKMVPPVELLEEERSRRHAIRSDFEASVALFRHMHPAYVHTEYDWSLGGARMTVARDRKMFSNAERHLPVYLQKLKVGSNKAKDFFSKELGHVMAVKSQLARSYQQQQQQQVRHQQQSATTSSAAENGEAAGESDSPTSRQQLPGGKVIATQAFLAVPTSLTHRHGSAGVRPISTAAADVQVEREKELSKKEEDRAAVLRGAFAEVVTARESTMRHTFEQSEDFQRMQIAQREQCDRLVATARATVHYRHQRHAGYGLDSGSGAGAVESSHSTSPMRVEFHWESTSMVSRNVAPPRPRDDVQRHLPSQFRRPNTAGSAQNQNRHPLTAGTVDAHAIPILQEPKRRDVRSAGPRPPQPPPGNGGATAPGPKGPPEASHAELIPVLSVLPRAVAAYRVHSAPVHRGGAVLQQAS